MLEMTHEHRGVTTRITVTDSANLEALEDAFTTMAHAMGYANSYVARIGPDEDMGESTTLEVHGLQEEPEAWVDYQEGEDAANRAVSHAAIEGERMQILLDVLLGFWPYINPFVLHSWANGYYESKEVNEELKFLAELLDFMEKEH